MSYTSVGYTKRDHIARITLNRPDANNVINQQLAQELIEVCSLINGDNDIYVVIISAAGSGAFCAGSELERQLQDGNIITDSYYSALVQLNMPQAVADIDRPVLAAVNGDALGQGLELTLGCDVRLASSTARFGLPQVTSGIMPLAGGTQRLPRLIGRGKALEMILTAEIIDAEEALRIGLVSKVVPPEELMTEIDSLAQTLADKAPIALRYIKEAVNKGMDITLEQGLHLEADLYTMLQTTADRTEGIRAFLERRTPEFKGE